MPEVGLPFISSWQVQPVCAIVEGSKMTPVVRACENLALALLGRDAKSAHPAYKDVQVGRSTLVNMK
jgi:hypothetical protein